MVTYLSLYIKQLCTKIGLKISRIVMFSNDKIENGFDFVVIYFDDKSELWLSINSEQSSLEILDPNEFVVNLIPVKELEINKKINRIIVHIDKEFSKYYRGEYGITFSFIDNSVYNVFYESDNAIVDSIVVNSKPDAFTNNFDIPITIG